MITAYLIDPKARTITTVQHDETNYHDIYKLTDCDTFCAVRVGEQNDAIFIDDSGLLQDLEEASFFGVLGPRIDNNGKREIQQYCLAGKGLVLGCDDEGGTIAPRISLKELTARIIWLTTAQGVEMGRELLAHTGEVVMFDSLDDMAAFNDIGSYLGGRK